MATNVYFQSGDTSGSTNEQRLVEDLVIESLKIYGHDVYYMPRTLVNRDTIFDEDELSKFTQSYPLEMYMENVEGYDGEGDLFTRFEYASQLANTFARDRESVREELEMWISILRDILIIKQGSEEWVNNLSELDILKTNASKVKSIKLINDLKEVDKAWNQLIQNSNARLCLENLMLNITSFKNTPTKVTS